MTPKLTLKNGVPFVDGYFDFFVEKKLKINKFGDPTFNISFKWSPELETEISSQYSEEELLSLMAEKLKQDFIQFAKNYNYEQNFQ